MQKLQNHVFQSLFERFKWSIAHIDQNVLKSQESNKCSLYKKCQFSIICINMQMRSCDLAKIVFQRLLDLFEDWHFSHLLALPDVFEDWHSLILFSFFWTPHVFECLTWFLFCLNDLSHFGQLYLFADSWISLMCWRRLCLTLNLFSHWGHVRSLQPSRAMWFSISVFVLNFLPQSIHSQLSFDFHVSPSHAYIRCLSC